MRHWAPPKSPCAYGPGDSHAPAPSKIGQAEHTLACPVCFREEHCRKHAIEYSIPQRHCVFCGTEITLTCCPVRWSCRKQRKESRESQPNPPSIRPQLKKRAHPPVPLRKQPHDRPGLRQSMCNERRERDSPRRRARSDSLCRAEGTPVRRCSNSSQSARRARKRFVSRSRSRWHFTMMPLGR